MGLKKLLDRKKSEIVKRWFDQVIRSFPSESSSFLLNLSDPFSNPVGATTFHSLTDTFEALITDKPREDLLSLLDPAIRIRAVQEFSPSISIAFVFFLKTIVHELAEKGLASGDITRSELDDFNGKVDGLSLIAFDIYMGCREQIFKFRAEHVKTRTLKLLEKADILCEVPEVGTDIIPHDVYKNGGFER
ncbi:RsbRD N-terminal domain-containing protein [Desulfatiferula olefinivorans]